MKGLVLNLLPVIRLMIIYIKRSTSSNKQCNLWISQPMNYKTENENETETIKMNIKLLKM